MDEQVVAEVTETTTPEPEVASVSEEETDTQLSEDEAEGDSTEEDGEKPLTRGEKRIQQLANETRAAKEAAEAIKAELEATKAKAESLEREFRQQQEATKAPDYIEITPRVLEQVNARLGELVEAKTNAELSGNHLAGIQAQKEIDAIYQGLQENETRRQEALKLQSEQQSSSKIMQELDERAEFYRQQNNIPADVWNQGGEWFAQQCMTDKTLATEFQDRARYGGPMAAIRFAADYVAQNMAAKTETVKSSKEEAKAKLPGGVGKAVKVEQELTDDLPSEEWYRIRREQKAKLRR